MRVPPRIGAFGISHPAGLPHDVPSVCETFAAYHIEDPWAQNPRKPLLPNAFAHCSPFPACCKPLTLAPRLSSAEPWCPCRHASCHLATSRREDYSLSRSIGWGGCSVVRRSLYAVACMYERTPVYSCAAGIEPAHPTARGICISVSLGRSLLVRVATLLAAFSPAAAISIPRNAPRIDECANARPNVARFRFRRYPSGRGAGRAQLSTLPIAARSCSFPPSGARAPLRSHSPRHASTQRAERTNYQRQSVADDLKSATYALWESAY